MIHSASRRRGAFDLGRWTDWLAGRSKHPGESRQPARRRRPGTLGIESLEDRLLLAAVSWDGGAGTLNWGDAANWSANTLPVAADDVSIDIAGTNTVTSTGSVSIKSLTSNETVSVTAGSFTLGGNSAGTGTIQVAGGTVNFAGTNWTKIGRASCRERVYVLV